MSNRYRIFISYAHADEKLAKSTYEHEAGYPSVFLKYLETSLPPLGGWIDKNEIFFDRKRLASEPEWDPAIQQALSECELFIFLVSPHSLGSEYCTVNELGPVVKRDVPVITVLLEPKDDWIHFPVPDQDAPSSPPLKKLGQFHSGGLPKDISGNVKAVSLWDIETEAWNEVCKDITEFLKSPSFNKAPTRAAMLAFDPAPETDTELQRMLAAHLHEHWPELARSQIFTGARVFRDLPLPLTAGRVFDTFAVSAKPVDLLARLRGFVGTGADGGSVVARLAEQPNVLEAVLRLTLVAAERYIASRASNLGVVSDEPVVDADPRVSAVLAAACFGFGIRLRPSSPVPENFIRPAADEFVHDQGGNSIKRDLRAAANRFTLEFPPGQISDEDVEDEEFLQALLDEARDKLGCQLVLLCHEQSSLRQPAFRATALCGLSVPVVFEGVPRDEVNGLLSSLRSVVKDLLDGLLGLPSAATSPPLN